MITIRALEEADYLRVKAIYQQGIEGGNATFTDSPTDWAGFDEYRAKQGRIVAENGETIVGWACLSKVSRSYFYRGVGETTVYVDSSHQGRGVGLALLKALVLESEQAGYWTLQALIFPENEASIHLHLKVGFKKLGVHEKYGKHHDVWRDVVLLERRSEVIGQS